MAGHVEDELGDVLDSRVAVGLEDRFVQRFEGSDQGVVLPQDHLVIELAVDPRFHHLLDVRKIGHHIAAVKCLRLDLDLDDGVVAVGMLADPFVVEQAMAVAEINTLRDQIPNDTVTYRRD